MKGSLAKIIAPAATLLFLALAVFMFVSRSATGQIRLLFPGAQVYFDPVNSPDITLGTLVRCMFPSYVGKNEDSVGFELADRGEPVDFSRLVGRGFLLHSIRLTRCKVTDLRPLASLGSPLVIFDDCDLSALPDEQRELVYPYDPTAPAPTRKLAYNSY
jgi:hypothetical protein